MWYYEYIFSGILSTELEEKTNELIKDVNSGINVPYNVHSYTDEPISEDKKKRKLVLHSHHYITDYLTSRLLNCGLEMHVYLKQRII